VNAGQGDRNPAGRPGETAAPGAIGPTGPVLRRAKSLTEQAEDEIRARILRGDFELGAPLSENTLAAELGASKTPIREALLRLKNEGLVEIKPQRGTFVFDMTEREIVELGQLRETLETGALRLTTRAGRAALVGELDGILARMRAVLADDDSQSYRLLDADFHQAFIDHCGNSYFRAAYAGVAFRVQALRTRLSIDPDLNRSSYGEHAGIRDRLAAGDLDAVESLIVAHARGTIADYAASLRERRDRAAS
jgi:DNA-binding GntR family transcriptional regulator